MRLLIRKGFYPFVLILSFLLVWNILNDSVSIAVAGLVPIFFFIPLLGIEYFFKAENDFKIPAKHRRVDLFFLLSFLLLFIFPGFLKGGFNSLVELTSGFYSALGWKGPTYVNQLPPWVAFILGWLGLEFVCYWLHRGIFHSKFYRAHASHHSAIGVYVLMGYRQHFLDTFLLVSVSICYFILLGFPFKIIGAIAIAQAVCSQMAHNNIDYDNPWLGKLFLTRERHRFHHSIDPRESNANFGVGLVIWDYIFGTVRVDENKTPFIYGLKDAHPNYSESFLMQVTEPFFPEVIRQKIRDYCCR